MSWNKPPYTLIGLCILVILVMLFLQDRGGQPSNADKSTTSPLYLMASTSRNSILYQMIDAKEYQAVINATDDGIQNHRELVWDDVAFWDHRAYAYFQQGNCVEALASAYHASMRDSSDQLLKEISSSAICSKTSQQEVLQVEGKTHTE